MGFWGAWGAWGLGFGIAGLWDRGVVRYWVFGGLGILGIIGLWGSEIFVVMGLSGTCCRKRSSLCFHFTEFTLLFLK